MYFMTYEETIEDGKVEVHEIYCRSLVPRPVPITIYSPVHLSIHLNAYSLVSSVISNIFDNFTHSHTPLTFNF